jgi:Uncharacterized protein conserved in bacteria
MRLAAAILSVFSLIFFTPAFAQEGKSPSVPDLTDMTVRISSFSGKPVPRFESLKYAAVHGRAGPSLDHAIAWRYERQGLPVLVIKESREWLKVRDPNGDEVWMHERTLGGRPSVMVFGAELVDMKARPNADGKVMARIESGAIANLIDCDGAFCEVYINRKKGWVAKTHLWGAPGTSSKPIRKQIAELSQASVESR